ncbi:hypothetical protein ACWEVY_27375 [Streptomyces longwoodensis]
MLVGATLPQLGPLSAARWSALLSGGPSGIRPGASTPRSGASTTGPDASPTPPSTSPTPSDGASTPRTSASTLLPAAFALEALANGVSYLAGPALVSVLGAAGRPGAGVLLAASLVVGGGLGLAGRRRSAPPVTARATRSRSRAGRDALLGPAFLRQAGLGLALGVFFGATQVSVTAYASGAARRTRRRRSTWPRIAPASWPAGRTAPDATAARPTGVRPRPPPASLWRASR